MNYLTIEHLSTAEIARVFSRIQVSPDTGCWLWTSRGKQGGYGKIKFRQRDEATHRFMWAWLVGPLPMGQARTIPNLDHFVCDTKRCCFPGHLKLVSPRDNVLRANGAAARNARKTHCKKGHELPLTPIKGEGRVCRTCRICRKEWHQSERYRQWNADFGQAYHQSKRYGPDREVFLKRQREYMMAWHRRRKASSQ